MAGAVGAENPLFQPMGVGAATREGAVVTNKAAAMVETIEEGATKAAAVVDAGAMVTAMVSREVVAATMALREAVAAARAVVGTVEWDNGEAATETIEEKVLAEATRRHAEGGGGASGEGLLILARFNTRLFSEGHSSKIV